jgi:DNA-binding response OmpR family regulator
MTDRSYSIMLVEDSPSQAAKLTSALEHEGWKVHWVSTAEDAFTALRESRPDLILLDYYLPDMRGDEVCRRIRMNIDSRGLPIVILTSNEHDELHGLDSGADDFILKSSDPAILMLRLRTLLQKTRSERPILSSGRDNLRSARLLAIDDNPAFLDRLRPELESEGYELETVLDSQEGLSLALSGNFDVIIIDLMMPNMDGIEICRVINESRPQNRTPAAMIVLMGLESRENLSNALEGGADDFVGKSNDFSLLKGRIRALLRRKFFAEENARILQELRAKELEALQERAAKEAAEARAALLEKLELSTRDLNRSREELKKANEAKDRFLAILSHELRTPLTPILAVVTQRVEDETVPRELRRDLLMIKRNVELEARLIDDLLDLTRIAQGKLDVRTDEVDLRPLIEHVVDIASTGEQPLPKIATDFEADNTVVKGDSSRLTQVLWNLLRNAIKFTPADGQVTLRLFNEKDVTGNIRVVVEVSDTGIGIDPKILPHIFDAFEQGGPQVTRQFGGLGLGLAISKAIIELQEGSLQAHSLGRGHGASFQVSLPAMKTVSPQDLTRPSGVPAEKTPAASPLQKSLHILLVEDHEDTRDILRRLLIMRGHRVSVAEGVSSAAETVRRDGPVDILISDVGLPDGTGFDVMRKISEIQPVRGIALSGYGMERDIQQSLKAGFSSHLTKPVDFDRLEKEIATVLAAPMQDRPNSSPHQGIRILLVEDNTDTAEAMKLILKSLGHEVTLATTIAEALASALKSHFDLIISDIGLPDGHGISLLMGVRQFCSTPAIALTAYGMQEDIDRCLKAGFSVHLTKPVENERLRKAIVELTKHRPT